MKKSWAFHRLPVFIIMVWLFGSLFPNFQRRVHARQAPQIEMRVTAGFDNVYKENQWIPLRISLENNGPNFTGSIEAYLNPPGSNQTTFSYPLQLPTVSRKEISLYIFPGNSYATQLKISLFSVNAKKPVVEQNISLTRIGSSDQMTGVIAGNPAAFHLFSLLDPPSGTARVEDLTFADLPEMVQGYGALDILVFSAVDTGLLTDRQRAAISDWVAWGGQLLVTGGPDWQQTVSGLQDLNILPVTPDETLTMQRPNAQDLIAEVIEFSESEQPIQNSNVSLVLTTGSLIPEAEILLDAPGDSDIPLISRMNYGKGQVFFFAFDPSLPPFSNWVGAENLYRKIGLIDNSTSGWGSGFVDWSMASQAAQSVPNLGLPSVLLVCGFLLLYIGVIGPANYFLLRRLRRRELGWITIPSLVIFFSGLVYLTGSLTRGQKPIEHNLSMVQVWEDSPRARVDGVVGIYSPYRATYDVASQPGTFLYPVPENSSGLINEVNVIQDGNNFQMTDLRVDISGVYPIAYQSTTSAPDFTNDLQLIASGSGTRLTGKITNASSMNLTGSVLLTSGGVLELGDLEAGEFIEIDQNLATSQTSSSTTFPGVFKTSPGMVSPAYPYMTGNTIEQILGTYDYYQNRETYRKFGLLTAVFGYAPANITQADEVILLGWNDSPAGRIDIKNIDESTNDLTLYTFSFYPEIQYEGDRWTLTPGFFRWSSLDPLRMDVSPYNQYLYSPTTYRLVFSPGYPLDFSEVESLTFHVLNPYQNGTVIEATFSLWDFTNQEWKRIENLVWGDNAIDSAEKYVATTSGIDEFGGYNPGTIRLEVQSTSSYLEINTSDFTLVVSR